MNKFKTRIVLPKLEDDPLDPQEGELYYNNQTQTINMYSNAVQEEIIGSVRLSQELALKSNVGHTHGLNLLRYNIKANNELQTTSPNYILIPGMTVTPEAGTYIVIAYTASRNSSNGAINRFSLYSANVEVTGTSDNIQVSNNRIHAWSASCEVTLNGSQAVEIRWNRSAGTASVFGRYLTLIKVASYVVV
jgi:hypothetical protein